MAKRKVCVVTGTRAEYGLLYWVIRGIDADPALELQLVVTGMHLSPEFGLTYQAIEADGFSIDAKVEMLLSSDSPTGIAKSIGIGVIGLSDAFARLDPDVVVLLGDRFEILAAAQAAMVARIPIAHIHGGEATEGAIDEAIRHAVTKMSHFHFVTTEAYRARVIQLGEAPERVWNVGAPGIDNLHRMDLLGRDQLEDALGFALGRPTLLVTYHPATLSRTPVARSIEELLRALESFPNARVVFTKANADTDGRVINSLVERFASERPDRARVFASLGQLRYLSLLKYSDVVIGNSSSGIIEAPAVKTPTVNLGDRQRGRVRADSVIDVPEEAEAIAAAIGKALSPSFREQTLRTQSPYGGGGAAERILECLREAELGSVLMKRFHDL